MRWSIAPIPLALLALAAGGEPQPPRPGATKLIIVDPGFHRPEVRVAMSMPPQFEVVFRREMPTPGWSFSIDAVDVDAKSGRIEARITEIAPEGMSAQVITETECRIPLGKLEPGAYSLELRVRRGERGPHVLAQALVLRAR